MRGNPFLVEEVTAASVDRRSRRLPPRLQDILLARTASLSPAAAEVLRIIAVGGPRIDDRLLRRVCPLAPEAVDVALRELLDCHALEPDSENRGYAFRHALTAEAVQKGRSLFAGQLALPVPDDPWGAVWRNGDRLREYRGDAHIAVWASDGLDPIDNFDQSSPPEV